MASEGPYAQTSLSRYRPALYVFASITAAYGLFYLHSHFLATPPHSSLRRRNAVRRPNARRRRGIPLRRRESQDALPFAGPIQQLDRLERENGGYGTFRIEVDDGRMISCRLIPSQLASIDQLQREIGVTSEHAASMRVMMEGAFLDNFLALQYPPAHVISQETGEWQYLFNELRERGISETCIVAAFNRFNDDDNFGHELRRRRENGEGINLAVHGNSIAEASPTIQPPDVAETTMDDQSVFSWRDGNDNGTPTREGQNLLNLLYHIAEDQARRDGYIHRGVTCNSCGAMPIQGIRYRCANCIDYDLCETCEAMQVHIKTHLFYKVRIPAPFLGNPRQSQPVWYPGKPLMLPRSLPRTLAKRLMKETNFENTELDALWDQFRCLANVEWPGDPNKLNMAIDRKTFDRCFVPNTSIRPPPPSLIYDRMFSFYDTNGDNLIGFEEFLKGLASFSNKSRHERLRRIFDGYDIDRDGYVERKDFLRIFRAYYTLSRELTRDMVAGMEDDFVEGTARDVILGSQPISSAFPGSIPAGEPSRIGEGKRTNLQGDMEIIDGDGILRADGDDTGDRNVAVGDAAVREAFGGVRPVFQSTLRLSGLPHSRSPPLNRRPDIDSDDGRDDGDDEDDATSDFSADNSQWPPAVHVQDEDIINALNGYVPLPEVTDHVDRARILTAIFRRMRDEDQHRVERVRRQGIHERWERRRFYIDEEDGATAPPGYRDELAQRLDEPGDAPEAVDDICPEPNSDSHVPSPRSRSSSKVRFQEDITDNEYDIRSNQSTSSRSIPVGERWGGFEVPEVEKDAGKEILYQVTQQGLNELLDLIFKPKEDLLMDAYRTRADRKRWAKEIEKFASTRPATYSSPDGNWVDKGGEETLTAEDEASTNRYPNENPLEQPLGDEENSVQPESVHPEDVLPAQQEAMARPAQIADTTLSSLDPTLPQHRPNQSDLEPFPPVPEQIDFVDSGIQIRAPGATPAPDPTLPQNRPNTPDLLLFDRAGSSQQPIHNTDSAFPPRLLYHPSILDESPSEGSRTPSTSSSSSSRSHSRSRLPDRSLPLRLRFQQPHTTSGCRASSSSSSSSSSEGNKVILPSPPRPPSPKTLALWTRLNQVEREARERGGTGAKLNFEEFAKRMQGERGRRLGFVGSWIDITSF